MRNPQMASMRDSEAMTSAEGRSVRANSAIEVHSPGLTAVPPDEGTDTGALSAAPLPPAEAQIYAQPPELQLLYETAPIGLAFLSPDCRYLQINRHLTEISRISVDDHIGRSVRDTVPQVADQVEHIVQTVLRTGKSISGIEV